MDNKTITTLQSSIREELDNILSFWMKYAPDNENGGFIGRLTNDLVVEKDAPKCTILNTRILWTFSTAYIFNLSEKYLEMARRAYDYLNQYFRDDEYGGAFWTLSPQGKPLDDKKRIYGQAFYIYGLSEYHRATNSAPALQRAKKIFELIEQKSYDTRNKGYFETYNRDWTLADDLRLSEKDMNEKKSMNNHLHVLEAYTNLYRAWNDPHLGDKLKELIDVFRLHIINPQTYHLQLFFDELWVSKINHISFGHDIEASWLLCEAAEVLAEPALLEEVNATAVKMAQAVFEEALDDDGGLFYEADTHGVTDFGKEFWPQAEAVVGFLNAYQLTQKQHFFDAACRAWNFIEHNTIDRQNGEWFWKIFKNGQPDKTLPKISAWKGPYHNSRACIEALKRLEKIRQSL